MDVCGPRGDSGESYALFVRVASGAIRPAVMSPKEGAALLKGEPRGPTGCLFGHVLDREATSSTYAPQGTAHTFLWSPMHS